MLLAHEGDAHHVGGARRAEGHAGHDDHPVPIGEYSSRRANLHRFHALATIETRGGGARAVVSLFRAEPITLPLQLTMMERHPVGSQVFWPLSGGDWLLAVASDENGRPSAPLMFRASGKQGICYAPNVWHHPLLALGQVSDYLVVDRDGSGVNLEEAHYETPYEVAADYVLGPRNDGAVFPAT